MIYALIKFTVRISTFVFMRGLSTNRNISFKETIRALSSSFQLGVFLRSN